MIMSQLHALRQFIAQRGWTRLPEQEFLDEGLGRAVPEHPVAQDV